MLNQNSLDNPKLFFEELGGLHDASVTVFSWNNLNRKVNISVDDLHSNFLGFPEYQGLKPAEIIFLNVKELEFNLQGFGEAVNIYDMIIEKK